MGVEMGQAARVVLKSMGELSALEGRFDAGHGHHCRRQALALDPDGGRGFVELLQFVGRERQCRRAQVLLLLAPTEN